MANMLRGGCEADTDAAVHAEEPWREAFLLDYAIRRYEEIDRLISQSRQSGQSLLTWQSAIFFGLLGIAAKAGLLRFSSHDCIVIVALTGALLSLAGAVFLTASAAFWTQPASIPVSPRDLFADLALSEINKRALCENLVEVYEDSKKFLKAIQGKIRHSLLLTGLSSLLIVTLFVQISTSHEDILDRLFSVK